ncbi:outer membrane lipoprotein LolB [Polaromonas sp. JS666]|uniref:outer membrane lipoprotein LolB n=1 Tax=Polaromonas sp. (strain JS666 / ATCC BAA-500) TaxID=296591 RepID=UPI0009444026|nr:outer membrane lipoprotein LolB [Polaromonas sp. JS666]
MPLTLPTRLARLVLVFAGFLTALVLAGCAQMPRATAQDGLKNEFWTGRISLQVQSEPVQSFSASFELRGGPERGELSLTSPLGNVLGVLRWAPGEALLDSGNGKVQRFASVDELMAQATGAAVPLGALFAWLRGDNAAASGWSADLSRYQDGRISAKRSQPAPQADLRVVLDQ